MRETILKLKKLNEFDVRLQMLRKDMARLPSELNKKDEEPRLIREKTEVLKQQIAILKSESDGLEEELKIGETALKRFNQQMSVARTQKEFDAIRRSIETQKQQNRKVEQNALEMMSKLDELQKERKLLLEKAESLEKALAEERKAVEAEVAKLKAEADTLQAERDPLAKDIPAKELAIYDRIWVNRGQAFATIERSLCSACFIQLPAQIHNLALICSELVTCPSCGRILIAELKK